MVKFAESFFFYLCALYIVANLNKYYYEEFSFLLSAGIVSAGDR